MIRAATVLLIVLVFAVYNSITHFPSVNTSQHLTEVEIESILCVTVPLNTINVLKYSI